MNKPVHDRLQQQQQEQQMTKTANAGEEGISTDREVAECATTVGTAKPSVSFINAVVKDDNTSETRDEAEEAEKWHNDGSQLLDARQEEFVDSSAVLRARNEKTSAFLFAHGPHGLLDEYWPMDYSLKDVPSSLDRLEKIPYWKNCLRDDLERARQILAQNFGEQVDSESIVRLSTKQEGALAKVTQEEVRQDLEQQFLEANKELLFLDLEQQFLEANKKMLLSSTRASITTTLVAVLQMAQEVKTQLLFLSGLSQAEGSLTHTTNNTASRTASEQCQPKRQKIEERGSEHFQVAQPTVITSPILTNLNSIDVVLPGLSTILEGDEATPAENRLQKVMKCIDDYLAGATFLLEKEKNYTALVTKAIKDLRGEIRTEVTTSEPSDHRGGEEAASTLSTSTAPEIDPSPPSEKYAPGAAAQETDGAQPWIQMLFQSIGECLEPSSSKAESPNKISLRKEAPIPSTKFRLKRSMDFLLRKEGRWEAVIFDDILTVPVEVKPGCRKSAAPETLWREATEQVLSRLAKHLFIGFSFAGYGVPCHITGIVVSMAAIQILHLRYENVGTPDAKLVLYASSKLPLMKAETFEQWTKSAGSNKQQGFAGLKEDLYGRDGKCGMDKVGVPKGIRVLFNLMQQPGKKLYGLSVDVKADILGVPLGSGASSIVFSKKGDASLVVKLSRYGIKSGIENEIKILKLLAFSPSDHLPKIVESEEIPNGQLRIKLGSVEMALPAIALSPAGQNVSAYLASDVEKGLGLGLIFTGVSSALKHMHDSQVCHCDVSPKNIIIALHPTPKAVLIDFSIARECRKSNGKPTSMNGFHGTPDYAHREIFRCALQNSQTWNPRPEHDKAGLGFTLAFFANGSIRPWDAMHPKTKAKPKEWENEELEGVINERLEIARDTIREFVGCDLKADILELLKCDES